MHRPVLQERAPTPAVIDRIDADTFLETQYLPEFRDQEYELIHGEMVEMAVPGAIHCDIAGELYFRLRLYERQHANGKAFIEAGFRSEFDHYLLLRPDVAYIGRARWSEPLPAGTMPVFPDLAAEVLSPSNSLREIREKTDLYLDNGASLVWLVFPDDEKVEVHAADGSVARLGIDDTLDGGDVMPGFTLPLRRLFDL